MKIEKLFSSRKNNCLVLLFKETDEVFVNTLRRLIMGEVPTLAIEEVEFYKNTSALYDEMLALRLALIPIKTDLKSYELKEKCSCQGKGCPKCELKIILQSSKSGEVTAFEAKSQDPKCSFVYDIPIVKLGPKQKIELEAKAILGQGKNHTKWSPGYCFFKNEQTIKIDEKKIKDSQELAKLYPLLFDYKQGKLFLKKENLYLTNAADALGDIPGIKVEEGEDYIFTLESWGQLSHKEILNQAADIFLEKLEEFNEKLKNKQEKSSGVGVPEA